MSEKPALNNDPVLTRLYKKKDILNEKILCREKLVRSRCLHERIAKSGGGISYPDWGIYPIWLKCLDCGESWEEGKIGWDTQKKLEKNVVKDTSAKTPMERCPSCGRDYREQCQELLCGVT